MTDKLQFTTEEDDVTHLLSVRLAMLETGQTVASDTKLKVVAKFIKSFGKDALQQLSNEYDIEFLAKMCL